MSSVSSATSTPTYTQTDAAQAQADADAYAKAREIAKANAMAAVAEEEEEEPISGVLSEEDIARLDDIEAQDEKYEAFKSEMDQDTYFKLLMTQLQHQDPTSPMKNEEMIAQMAQFSIVEQTASTAEGMDKLLTAMTSGNTTNAAMNTSLNEILKQLEALNTSIGTLSDKQSEQISAIEKETGLIQELINTNKAQAAYQ